MGLCCSANFRRLKVQTSPSARCAFSSSVKVIASRSAPHWSRRSRMASADTSIANKHALVVVTADLSLSGHSNQFSAFSWTCFNFSSMVPRLIGVCVQPQRGFNRTRHGRKSDRLRRSCGLHFSFTLLPDRLGTIRLFVVVAGCEPGISHSHG